MRGPGGFFGSGAAEEAAAVTSPVTALPPCPPPSERDPPPACEVPATHCAHPASLCTLAGPQRTPEDMLNQNSIELTGGPCMQNASSASSVGSETPGAPHSF